MSKFGEVRDLPGPGDVGAKYAEDEEPLYEGNGLCPFCGAEAVEDGYGWIWCAGTRRACGWGETI